ncbi:MAG: hypothetical protein ACK4QW_13635 [Alphaproteobacteria bacterium]
MKGESIEALERAWQDLFRRILEAGREQGERAAFERIMRSIQAAAGELDRPLPGLRTTDAAPAAPAVAPAGTPASEDERRGVVPLRAPGREWESPGGD